MYTARERRTRRKLLFSSITLCLVLITAAVAQRRHEFGDPFLRTVDTRSRSVDEPSRAVFGKSRPDPLADDPLPRETPAQQTEKNTESAGGAVAVPADILGFLERWRSTLANGDIDTHTQTYAPRVDVFFRQKRVTRDAVKREKARLVARYPNVNKYELHDVRLASANGDRAVVTFRKDWDTSGAGSRRFAGSENQRLTLRRTGGEWKIVGEVETKVHWLRRS